MVKNIIAIVIVGVVCFGIGYGVEFAFSPDTAPQQPIEFSHKIHAGDNKIPCQYCHTYADKSRVAGVPNVQRCMGCHKVIKTDSPEIQKLTGYWDRKDPIPWVKVYNLPDFVHFTHKRHIKAGRTCQECHGEVQNMARITRADSLITGQSPGQMGWCLSCHAKYEVKNGWDCWTCHK